MLLNSPYNNRMASCVCVVLLNSPYSNRMASCINSPYSNRMASCVCCVSSKMRNATLSVFVEPEAKHAAPIAAYRLPSKIA